MTRTSGDRQFGQVVGADAMAWAHDSKRTRKTEAENVCTGVDEAIERMKNGESSKR